MTARRIAAGALINNIAVLEVPQAGNSLPAAKYTPPEGLKLMANMQGKCLTTLGREGAACQTTPATPLNDAHPGGLLYSLKHTSLA